MNEFDGEYKSKVIVEADHNENTTPDILTLILALAGFLKLTLSAFGIEVPNDLWDSLLNALAAVLTAVGVVVNTYALKKNGKLQKSAVNQVKQK